LTPPQKSGGFPGRSRWVGCLPRHEGLGRTPPSQVNLLDQEIKTDTSFDRVNIIVYPNCKQLQFVIYSKTLICVAKLEFVEHSRKSIREKLLNCGKAGDENPQKESYHRAHNRRY